MHSPGGSHERTRGGPFVYLGGLVDPVLPEPVEPLPEPVPWVPEPLFCESELPLPFLLRFLDFEDFPDVPD